jgi:DNA-binding LacI/PurR family transcriptional regulator
VPDDVSLIGFDDIPEAAYFVPPLSTVRQDFGELGRRSLELLVQLLGDSSGPPGGVLIPPELVVRASARPAPRA